MDGRNLFESRAITRLTAKLVRTQPRPGVFISHSRRDKKKARAVARALKASNVDYYFDENDEELQLADEKDDHLKVVRCIEHGIEVCSHLLGIITEDTKGSWWVHYEIGRATGRTRRCAHLIDEEVERLPSYIKAAEILTNRKELRNWLPRRVREGSSAVIELTERLIAELDYPENSHVELDRSRRFVPRVWEAPADPP
jgi:hypothetical protein